MAFPEFNRSRLVIKKLDERKNKVNIETDHIPVSQEPVHISADGARLVEKTAGHIRMAREKKSSVMIAFGAHTVKNGMAPVLISLMEKGWLTHLATNGAAIIHDWEFAWQGKSSEDVRENIKHGQFGIWEETGFYINLALVVGAYEGLGYGESIGKMISREGLQIPETAALFDEAEAALRKNPGHSAATLDLATVIINFAVKPGFLEIPHPFKKYSIQARAYDLGIPFTGHPMIGHDIIYCHPLNHGAAVGRTAMHDFLRFAAGVSNLDFGVYMSIGSAVMSPMIFEKSFSMAQNLKIQENGHIDNHYMLIVDLAKSGWDWHRDGEPPPGDPAYYLRFCKTFNRMGGELQYLTADNRDFLLALHRELVEK